MDHLFHHAIKNDGSHDRSGGVSTHATRVGPLVSIFETFVILTGRERENVFAIAQNDKAGFFAEQALLNHDARTGSTERAVAQHGVDRCVRFVQGRRDDDPFACGQAIGFDDDRCALCVYIAVGSSRVGKGLISSCWNAVTHHECFGKVLGAFELRGGARGSENFQTLSAKRINDTLCQRRFGAHDRQCDLLRTHKIR